MSSASKILGKFRPLQCVIVLCLIAVTTRTTEAASVVHSSAGPGQAPLYVDSTTLLPNGSEIWVGLLENIPNLSNPSENLQQIFEDWIHIGATQIRPLPFPDSESEGLFASTHVIELAAHTNKNIYWLVIYAPLHPSPILPGDKNAIKNISHFGLFSSGMESWKLPSPNMPIPFNSTRLNSNEVDNALFGSLENGKLILEEFHLNTPNPIPNDYDKIEMAWGTPSEEPNLFLAFGQDGNPAPDKIWFDQLKPAPGSNDSSALHVDLSDPQVETLILFTYIDGSVPNSINLSGMEIEFLINENFFSLINNPENEEFLNFSFQSVASPGPIWINQDSWNSMNMTFINTMSDENIGEDHIKVRSLSGFGNSLKTDSQGGAWVAIKLDASTSFPFTLYWTQIKLFTKKIQNNARVTKITQDGQNMILNIFGEPNLPLRIDISEDLMNWSELFSLPASKENNEIIFSFDDLPATGVVRVSQPLHQE